MCAVGDEYQLFRFAGQVEQCLGVFVRNHLVGGSVNQQQGNRADSADKAAGAVSVANQQAAAAKFVVGNIGVG